MRDTANRARVYGGDDGAMADERAEIAPGEDIGMAAAAAT
jgi:hypothetical protein